MDITLTYQGEGAAFLATNSEGSQLIIDGSTALGGLGLGPRPMEMVLFGLAGCAAMDVLHIIRKGRGSLTHAIINAHGKRAESTPAVFTHIKLMFELGGPELSKKQAKRAIDLSIERYCSVAQMLSPTVHIEAELTLLGE